MMKPSNPAITASAITRRESYQALRTRREQENARQIASAQQQALHVMDVIDAIRSGPLPMTVPHTASHPDAKTMDEVVAEIVMKPQPHHFINPLTVCLAQRVTATLAALMVFLAGVAVGKIW